MRPLFSDPTRFVLFIAALVVGLTIHECAHALVADRLGDPTARRLGRITLNPIAHLDPMGAIMILVSSFIGVGFGWGKPVPVNPANLRCGPRTGVAIVAAAGPVSNLLLTVLLFVALQQDLSAPPLVGRLLITILSVNVTLAIFNLIPLPPLDGFSVLLGILPRQAAYGFSRVAQYGPALLLLLVFFGQGLLSQGLLFAASGIIHGLQLAYSGVGTLLMLVGGA